MKFHADSVSERAAKKANLPTDMHVLCAGIKVYALLMRNAFSADLYANGVNPAVTKKLMGHKNEEMSLNAYASASDEDAFEVMMNRKYKQ